MKNRRKAREAVFALLFEWSFKEDQTLDELLTNAIDARDLELDDFAKELAETTMLHMKEIDSIIANYSHEWKVNRISKATLACLRMSFGELLYFPDIPPGVTANEAVELLKEYGTEEEAVFLNGILGEYIRQVRKGENQ